MDPIIQELEIEVLRSQKPYNKLSTKYLTNFFNHYGCYPSEKAADMLIEIREELEEKENIFFIDSYQYELVTNESGFFTQEIKSCKASTLQAEALQKVLNLKDHDKTNVVIGFVSDNSVHYDIVGKSKSKIISIVSK